MVTFPYKKHPSGNFYPVVDFNIYFENSTFYTSALVDSGASISVFTPETAKLLNLTIEKGKEIFLGGAGGRIKGYIHNLQFKIVEKVLTAPVVFSHEYLASYNLLGRNGVFENFKICFEEAGQKVLFEKI